MLNKTETLKQESGEDSVNIQGITGKNVSVSINGISYSEARLIAQDVFDANFYKLSSEANQIAHKRAEELIDDFLKKLSANKPDNLFAVKNPDMQFMIYSAQKEYARSGDKALEEMLVDVLLERAKVNERNLKQIVLNESLNVIPKLTSNQLDTLSLIFILKYTRNFGVVNLQSFYEYMNTYIVPFIVGLSDELSCYQHLEFAGCGTIQVTENQIQEILKSTYWGLFCKGFSIEQFKQATKLPQAVNLLTNCLHDHSLYQINAIDINVINKIGTDMGLIKEDIEKIKDFQNKYMMTNDEIKNISIKANSEVLKLYDIWSNSAMKNMTLTSVGIAIAQANIRRRTNISFDLGVWIK